MVAATPPRLATEFRAMSGGLLSMMAGFQMYAMVHAMAMVRKMAWPEAARYVSGSTSVDPVCLWQSPGIVLKTAKMAGPDDDGASVAFVATGA